jgi:hypothetical protein
MDFFWEIEELIAPYEHQQPHISLVFYFVSHLTHNLLGMLLCNLRKLISFGAALLKWKANFFLFRHSFAQFFLYPEPTVING